MFIPWNSGSCGGWKASAWFSWFLPEWPINYPRTRLAPMITALAWLIYMINSVWLLLASLKCHRGLSTGNILVILKDQLFKQDQTDPRQVMLTSPESNCLKEWRCAFCVTTSKHTESLKENGSRVLQFENQIKNRVHTLHNVNTLCFLQSSQNIYTA